MPSFALAPHPGSDVDHRLIVRREEPVIGAAVTGSAEHASGMCPSPANKPGSRIEPDPSRPGQIHFRPRVQIGDVLLRAAWPVERLHIRRKLDQIARNKPRRQPRCRSSCTISQPVSRHEPLCSVSVSSGRLNARLHPDQILDPAAAASDSAPPGNRRCELCPASIRESAAASRGPAALASR